MPLDRRILNILVFAVNASKSREDQMWLMYVKKSHLLLKNLLTALLR